MDSNDVFITEKNSIDNGHVNKRIPLDTLKEVIDGVVPPLHNPLNVLLVHDPTTNHKNGWRATNRITTRYTHLTITFVAYVYLNVALIPTNINL